MNKNKLNYIAGLDGMRCFSILFVIFEHIGLKENLKNFIEPVYSERVYLIFSGKTGVSLFFVISGYLITSILLKEKLVYSKIDFPRFFMRRFLRLFPAFFVFLFGIFIFYFFSGKLNEYSLKAIGISFIYLYNFVPYGSLRFAEIGHTWSLAIEEQFYLIWPLIIHFLKDKSIILLLSFLTVFFIFFKFIYDQFLISSLFEAYRITIPGAYPILLGCFVAILIEKKITLIKSYIWILGIMLWINPFLFFLNDFSIHEKLNFILQPIGLALILYMIVLNQTLTIVSFLEISIFIWVGKLSYSIYLWQGLFLKNGPGSNFWIQQFPQNLFCTILMAVVSFYFIEKKFIKKKKRFRVIEVNHA